MAGGLRAASYRRRVVDAEIDELVAGGIAAVALEGAKAVGKSATAAERAAVTFQLEDPATRELLAADPDRILAGAPTLIDEWQHLPQTWDRVRRAVDAGASAGQFFLTGSALTNPGTHSGAGRIVKIRMRPLSLWERGLDTATVSLAQLLTGTRPVIEGSTSVGLDDYVTEIARSGFPGVAPLGERVRRAQLDSYIERVIDRDFPDLMGRSVRNPSALRRWLTAYGAATSTCATYERVRDAATAGEGDKPARSTTTPYRDTLEALSIIDPLPAWSPTASHINELAGTPKHQLVDPALAAGLLGLGPQALLSGEEGAVRLPRDGTFLGALFESLVTLSVRVYAQAAEARVGHLRTHRGEHEVDLIVERRDRRVVAIEVKLSATVDEHDVRHLTWLRDRIGPDLLDTVVITTGRHAYRRPDSTAIIPAALLGP